ncbi:MAG: RHS repeat protein, partial [Planctomycetes bacterium]|nr:RHS repeat protein [Planctomycetota bacterium]
MSRSAALWGVLALGLSSASADVLDDPALAKAVGVSPLTGRLTLELEDLRPGGDTPWPLSLRRSYLPGWGDPHNHGSAWVTLLDARLVPWQDGFLLLEANGALRRLAPAGDGWVTVDGRQAQLERAEGGFVLTHLAGRSSFDAEGRLVRVSGQPSLELERDDAGRVRAVRGPWGTVAVERDDAGRLLALSADDGRRVEYARDAAGQLTEVRRPGVRQRYAYDAQGRLTELGGGLVQVRYDDAGRVAEVSTQGLEPARYAYADGEDGSLTRTLTQGERVVRHVVSNDLRRIRVESPTGTRVTELDARGRVVREVRDGVEVTRSYDAQGRLIGVESPAGASRFVYAGPDAASPRQVRTPEGSWTFTYDAQGHPTLARSSAGSTRWVYDELGRPVRVVAADGATLELSYDASHRRSAARLTQGARTLERKVQRPAGIFGVTTLTQGDDGRTRTVERKPDGSLLVTERDSAGAPLRALRYDALGRAVERTNARGVTRSFDYDALGRWVSVAGAAGPRLQASYDAWGELEALRDGNGNRSGFAVEDGWVVVDEPSWGERRTRTTPARRTDRAGDVELESRFNERGQLIARSLPEGEQRFRYDAEGRLVEASGPAGGLRYAYDAGGRLSRVSIVGVDAGVDYSYTEDGRVQRVSYPWGSVEHRYDDAGRLEVLDLGDLGEVRFGYDAQGRRERVLFPSGVETRTAYLGDRVAEIRTTRGEVLLERRAYTYDATGRLTAVAELEGEVALEHDAEGQLVAARGPDFARAYRYDAMGNRTAVERDGARVELEVAAGNRLVAQGAEAFAYGPRGALTRRGTEDVATDYRYDSLNRLVAARLPDGSEVRYGYAPNGTRLWREDAAGRTYFVPGASGPVAEVGADGELRVGYLQGLGLDDVLGAVREGAFYAAHRDCVNSVTALTGPEGDVVARYRYTPFGEARAAEGGDWNRLRYTGRPLDAATGLYDLRARNYAPDLGRFTSPDPATYRGGANFYA